METSGSVSVVEKPEEEWMKIHDGGASDSEGAGEQVQGDLLKVEG